ncbi:hypothetical protein C8J57DRAFT_1459451 [Mycena rebaudengoi]|nr:hypothetical protein C8J57DRAFT_1459451 [Mycena rebaudengoi]
MPPLAPQGSQVIFEGGTFNDVAGNMNQTFTTVVSQQSKDVPSISAGYSDDYPAPSGTELIRPRTVRAHVNNRTPHSRSQRPHEYYSTTGIEAIVDQRTSLQDFDKPALSASTQPHREELALQRQTCPDDPLTTGPSHGLLPSPPPHLPRGIGSRIPQSALHAMAVPHINPCPTAPQCGVSHSISNTIHGNMTQTNLTSYGESGIDILYRRVVTSALHDSGERFDEPACHPRTRGEILNELHDWAHDGSPEGTPLLWLHGSAGAGKSAIAQEFAGRCHKEGRLGGSFFFKRGHAERGTWHGLVPTLAYQLAMFSPKLRAAIQQMMEADKLLVGRSLSEQFNKLFMSVLKQVPLLHPPPVILIDGLDECEDHRIQAQILRLLIGAIREQPLSICLLIVSRPEPHLRDILGNTHDIFMHLAVSADESAYEDIRTYLCDEFARIHREHSVSGMILKEPWPPQDALDYLVEQSSGIFIYAKTVIRFVDDEYLHPNDRLESVLRLDPQSTAPLDDLYTEILSSASHHPMLLHVLHAALSQGRPGLEPEEIDWLLELSRGTARLCLRGLHSILKIPPPRTRYRKPVDVLHASLRDYFCDLSRSGVWCLSIPSFDSALAHQALRISASPFNENASVGFYDQILDALMGDLGDHLPPNKIMDVLQIEHVRSLWFGHSYSGDPVHEWIQRQPSLPPDLKHTWTESVFIAELFENLKPNTNSAAHPSCRFDHIYKDILSTHPQLLEVLRLSLIRPAFLFISWELGFFGCTREVFRPLCTFSELLVDSSFPEGDSPLDFLSDLQRAGPLYEDSHNIAEMVVIRWIRSVKALISGQDINWNVWDRLSPMVLQEIETLDLSQLCVLLAMDSEAHEDFHLDFSPGKGIDSVIDWLRIILHCLCTVSIHKYGMRGVVADVYMRSSAAMPVLSGTLCSTTVLEVQRIPKATIGHYGKNLVTRMMANQSGDA